MRNKNPDDNRVKVLEQQNEMSVHNVEWKMEGPHLVEDWVSHV